MDKFQKLLCRDRGEYQERLDFFECRFNAAIAKLRATARRDALNSASHLVSLTYDDETAGPSPEVESALASLRDGPDRISTDFLYRSKMYTAIDSLPLDERRVVELFLKGFPIDSQETDVQTMVKILGCAEKTVRNRRDRAFNKLRALLKEEDAK